MLLAFGAQRRTPPGALPYVNQRWQPLKSVACPHQRSLDPHHNGRRLKTGRPATKAVHVPTLSRDIITSTARSCRLHALLPGPQFRLPGMRSSGANGNGGRWKRACFHLQNAELGRCAGPPTIIGLGGPTGDVLKSPPAHAALARHVEEVQQALRRLGALPEQASA